MFLDKEGFGFFAKQLSLTKNCQIQETANTKKINSPNDFKYGNKFNDFCIRVIHIQNFKKGYTGIWFMLLFTFQHEFTVQK